ncbi:MAG: S46 family peptidase [Acidobacteriota bacterium]
MSILAKARAVLAFLLILGLGSVSLIPVQADEGLWTFDNPPLKQLKERYQFEPTKEWLNHVRLSSARLNDGGSGSFVSPNGLVMTNHHVASGQLAKLSTEQRDLVETGFYARTQAEELRCPDLEINVLVSMDNVTERVQSASRNADDKKANELRKAEIAKIEKESTEKTGLRSDVIALYGGGEYWLYRFKKYTDIRLVFAPEKQMAFFGGDPDNFTYPRFNLDVTFLRVYENDKPIKSDHYFRWSANGPQENELIFVSGNPGGTDRLQTLAQLEYARDNGNPLTLRVLKRRRDILNRYSTLGAEQQRRALDQIFGIENSIKAITGYQEGLLNPKVMAKKVSEEQELRRRVAENAELQKAYGGAWDQIADAYKKLPAIIKRVSFSNLRGSRLAGIANALVRYASEIQKPNTERLEEYRDSNLESLKFQLLSPAPIYTDMEEFVLANTLQENLEELGANEPAIQTILAGRQPADVAKELIGGTKLTDIEFRKSLLEGGAAAIERSNDPLIQMARKLDPILRGLRRTVEEQIESVEASAGEKIAKARFAVYGKTNYPDATFSLRLSFGKVTGYELGTTYIPYKTTYHGLYDRAASFDNKPPFDLPPRLLAKKNAIDLSTPFNFVCTADIIGGNSGSPVINRNAEIVGLIFDGNIQSLVLQYLYTDETARSVAVHSAGIIEALRNIYDAGSLADELQGRK